MPGSDALAAIPLPRQWPSVVRSAVIHSVSLAFTALTATWSRGASERRHSVCLATELDRAHAEIALLKEELSIKDTRWGRVSPRRRPYYRPYQRTRILELKAARGWSALEAAKVFLVTEETITSWLSQDQSRDSAA